MVVASYRAFRITSYLLCSPENISTCASSHLTWWPSALLFYTVKYNTIITQYYGTFFISSLLIYFVTPYLQILLLHRSCFLNTFSNTDIINLMPFAQSHLLCYVWHLTLLIASLVMKHSPIFGKLIMVILFPSLGLYFSYGLFPNFRPWLSLLFYASLWNFKHPIVL